MTLIQALVWNLRTCILMLRENHKQKPCGVMTTNTDAKYRGGAMCSSEEYSVME